MYQVASISGGKDQTLVLLKSGEILGWGGAGSGLITPPFVDICSSFKVADAKPVFVGKLSACSHISAGYGVSLGVSNQQQTLIWGFCQVGTGGQNLFSEEPTLINGIASTSKVVAGQFIYAAIDQFGKVYSWGLSTDGALGRPSAQINALPEVITSLPDAQDIAIGDNFMIALTKDQRVYGWGSNSSGQLGLGHLNVVNTPEPISLISLSQEAERTIITQAINALRKKLNFMFFFNYIITSFYKKKCMPQQIPLSRRKVKKVSLKIL